MAATATLQVPHLGGITVGYALSGACIDPTKPTVVLINSMCMTVSLYKDQFNDSKLTNAVNLLAIEPLGHGATHCPATENYTYWDTAVMALQFMSKLGVQKAFALGTSQGGWMVVRMALLAPDRILAIMPLGTSMDAETADSREKRAWDPVTLLSPFFEKWSAAKPTPDFVIEDQWLGLVTSIGFGAKMTPELVDFWHQTLRSVYSGDEGRKKAKGALANLLSRDSLLLRLRDVKCPVYWLQGTEDVPFGKTLPAEQIKMFTSSLEATLSYVEGGAHYLNVTSPDEVRDALLGMISKHA